MAGTMARVRRPRCEHHLQGACPLPHTRGWRQEDGTDLIFIARYFCVPVFAHALAQDTVF